MLSIAYSRFCLLLLLINRTLYPGDVLEELASVDILSSHHLTSLHCLITPYLNRHLHHPTADKSINYSLPTDQMLSYSAHPIYPPIPYTTDDLGHAPGALTPSDVSSSISPPNGQIGNTKYSTSIPSDRIASALGQEEHARHSAEEDRRRRNTAASARFRMKKKQREQTLERSVRETTERNAALEARVAQLEMENRWLKNLLTEKHEATSSRAAPSSNETPEKNQKSTSNATGSGQKHIQPKKKGVGTDA